VEQQLVGICSQQLLLQAEDALSQGLERLQQLLADTVGSGSLNDVGELHGIYDHGTWKNIQP